MKASKYYSEELDGVKPFRVPTPIGYKLSTPARDRDNTYTNKNEADVINSERLADTIFSVTKHIIVSDHDLDNMTMKKKQKHLYHVLQ